MRLNLIDTEIAIKAIKDYFEKTLADKLSLIRVSAPLFIKPETGLNDNLNGYEQAVSFEIKSLNANVEIVQSLAKWKRYALKKYNFQLGSGLYTDMNAIRKDEIVDNIHSIYVDQWDWEKVITKEQRNEAYLFETVKTIYEALKNTEKYINQCYLGLKHKLPEQIHFISTTQLETQYPKLTSKEREYVICKKNKAVFIYQIGHKLANGYPHDCRAADYDDWSLNGDILVYHQPLDIALELSSMGIRVDKNSLEQQLIIKNEVEKLQNEYCQSIIKAELPYTVGGGIGQSRLCLFLLEKHHIGEVQVSIWPSDEELKSLDIL